jgi:endonuclease YncB( thermonuclease family)
MRDHSDRSTNPQHADVPEVGRPRGSVWRPLYAEGIAWEGQVFVAGGEHDLAARLIVTKTRLALISGGDVALEVPRRWLRPDARLKGDDRVVLSITPETGIAGTSDTDRIVLIVRNGRAEAERLVSRLTGHPVTADGSPAKRMQAESPVWDTRVGAAPAMALPPLPDFGDEDAPRDKRQWPPVGPEAVPPPAPKRQAAPKPATESIAAWTARNLDRPSAPQPDPVPATVSRAAKRMGTLSDGKTVSDLEVPVIPPKPGGGQVPRVVRGLQVAILAVLLGTGWYFGADQIASDFSFEALRDRVQELTSNDDPDGSDEVSQTGANIDAPTATATTPPQGDGTGGAGQADLNNDIATEEPTGTEEDTSTGLGGATEELPEEYPTAEPTDEPVPTDEPAPTEEEVVEEPTAEPTDEPAPTEEPTAEPTEEPTLEPTEEPAPTEEPTTEPTAEPTDEPTAEPTTEPTTEPTDEPVVTETPAATATTEPTAEPTATETAAATETPTTEATEVPTEAPLEPQKPSVDPSTTPVPEAVVGPFRYTIAGAALGEEIATELPEVQAVTYGEWVVLSVHARNTSGTEQVFDMSQFKLLADGEEVLLDTGNSWIASMLGYTPAYGNTESILWAPDEAHQIALTFLAPLDAESLVLQIGDQAIDLSESLAASNSLTQGEQAVSTPEPYEATVVEVVDAETIVVEKDGIRQTVKYLGVEGPTGEDCFAAEATAANSELVAGKTVRLERQATNTDAKGNWVRDVWVANEDGSYTLVSQALVREGAMTAAISEPNTRFASWLTASQATAESEALGMWSACAAAGDGSGETVSTSSTTINRWNLNRPW